MENLKIRLDDIELASVPVELNTLDSLSRDAAWQGEGIKIHASLCNENLSLHVACEKETVLIFAGKIAGPVTFECKLADGKKLTLHFQ